MADKWSQYEVATPAATDKWSQYEVSPVAPAASVVAPIAKAASVTPGVVGATEPVYDPMTGLQVGEGPTGSQPTTMNPAARAGIIGGGMGLTAGLAKYPVAGVAWAVDNGKQVLKGQGMNGVSWNDALRYTGDELHDTQQANPVAYGVGNVAGSAVGMGKLASLGKAAGLGATASTIAAGTAQGAANGYSQNESGVDAAEGGAFGGFVGSLGALGTRAVRAAANTQAGQAVLGGLNDLVKTAPDKVTAVIKDLFPEGMKNVTVAEVGNRLAQQMKIDPVWGQQILQKIDPSPLKTFLSATWNQVKSTAGDAVTGGVLGAGAAGATGHDPMQGAAWGAGAAVLNGKKKVVSQLPSAIMSMAQRAPNAVEAGVNGAIGATNATVIPPVVQTGDRLRALADRMKASQPDPSTWIDGVQPM